MKKIAGLWIVALLLGGCGNGVYFEGVADGDTVKSPLKVGMGVCGMEVEPAGKVSEGRGHHHLIVDGACIPQGEIVPKDATHMHFGKGQTGATLRLTPGMHTLTLQFANGVHASYGEEMCKSIAIKVE